MVRSKLSGRTSGFPPHMDAEKIDRITTTAIAAKKNILPASYDTPLAIHLVKSVNVF